MSGSAFLFDTNVWVALTFDAHPLHRAALDALAGASKRRPACFCRATQQSFLRLASTPAVLRAYGVSGLTNDDALRTYEALAAAPGVAWRDEPAGIDSLWPRLGARGTASPHVWMDAYLAAFAIAGGLLMVTTDDGFEKFTPRGLELTLVGAR